MRRDLLDRVGDEADHLARNVSGISRLLRAIFGLLLAFFLVLLLCSAIYVFVQHLSSGRPIEKILREIPGFEAPVSSDADARAEHGQQQGQDRSLPQRSAEPLGTLLLKKAVIASAGGDVLVRLVVTNQSDWPIWKGEVRLWALDSTKTPIQLAKIPVEDLDLQPYRAVGCVVTFPGLQPDDIGDFRVEIVALLDNQGNRVEANYAARLE